MHAIFDHPDLHLSLLLPANLPPALAPLPLSPLQEQDPERRAAMHAIKDTRVDVCLYFVPPHRLRKVWRLQCRRACCACCSRCALLPLLPLPVGSGMVSCTSCCHSCRTTSLHV